MLIYVFLVPVVLLNNVPTLIKPNAKHFQGKMVYNYKAIIAIGQISNVSQQVQLKT